MSALFFYVLLEFRTLFSPWRAHRSHASRSEVVYGHTSRAPVSRVRCGQSVLALERRRSKTCKHSRCLPQVKVSFGLSNVSFALLKDCSPRFVALSSKHVYVIFCLLIHTAFYSTPNVWMSSRSIVSRAFGLSEHAQCFLLSREYWPYLEEFETVQKFYRRRQKFKCLIARGNREGPLLLAGWRNSIN